MDRQQINHNYLDYHFSSDKSTMQWEIIHDWLANHSYWAKNVPFETVKLSGENSYCTGIFYQKKQIGYARIVTDYHTFGYLADVFIMKDHRKKGLSKILMKCIMELRWIGKLRRFMLATMDAHALYQQYGFVQLANPERFLEINKPDIYMKVEHSDCRHQL